MRIFICPTPKQLQPDCQNFVWPPRNGDPGMDFGVEQDFHRWLYAHPDIMTRDPDAADWGYIPIFFNRLYINNPDADGHWGGGREFHVALANELERLKTDYHGLRLFTVCEYDLAVLSPYLDLGGVTVFCASRREPGTGIDIPLLSAPHPYLSGVPKTWLASFMGHMQTDGCRSQMGEILADRQDVTCRHANQGPDAFRDLLQASYLALAPRGQGVQSFRMYEAMQLGVAPVYISDDDARPFQRWLHWDEVSFWVPSALELPALLDELDEDRDLLLEMGRRAKVLFDGHLAYGQWCPYVLRELERL
jgi:hypothetical protein